MVIGDIETAFQRRYALRRPAKSYISTQVTVPPMVIELAMKEAGIKDTNEFREKYQGVWCFSTESAAILRFEQIEEDKEKPAE